MIISWTTYHKDGTASTSSASLVHALRLGELVTVIETGADISALTVSFGAPPDSFTVQIWNDEYIGSSEHFEDFETIESYGASIMPQSGAAGYVYELQAKWQQGVLRYVFHII